MGAGGLLQVRVDAERPEVMISAGAIVQRKRASLIGVQEDLASPALRHAAGCRGRLRVRDGDADRGYDCEKIETNKTARYFTITSPPRCVALL